jgi:superfamily II DNA helicase RecQ
VKGYTLRLRSEQIPTVQMGGMTLVVEPFKALIKTQLQRMKDLKQVRVEKLLASDAGEKRAAERLAIL